MRKVDVAIIGAGTSGLSARREVAKVTENYVVIDDGPLGTTCARVGCMPSKVLIQSANDFYRRFQFSELGIQGGETLKIDRPQVWKQVRKLRDRFVKGVRSDMKSWENEHLVRKHAIFLDSNTLKLTDPLNSNDEEKIQAKSIVIALSLIHI